MMKPLNPAHGSAQMTRAKLTVKQVREIRARYRATLRNGGHLAREYGVNNATISHIVRRQTWKWVQ